MDMYKFKWMIILAICLSIVSTGCSLIGGTGLQVSPGSGKSDNNPVSTAVVPAKGAPTSISAPTVPPSAATNVQSVKSANNITPAGNPLDVFNQTTSLLGAVKSYRAKALVQGPAPDQQSETDLEVISPDRSHLTNPNIEMISIGQTLYYRLGANGAWTKTVSKDTGGAPFAAALVDPSKLIANAAATKNVTYSRTELIDGKQMDVFQYAPTSAEDPNQSSGTLWVGVADGLPYQLVEIAKDGTKTTVTFYDYNVDFKIEPPIP